MKADFKKRLVAIQKELKNLIEDHQCWMEEHEDPDWEYTPAGEKASDESTTLDYALDYIQDVTQIELD